MHDSLSDEDGLITHWESAWSHERECRSMDYAKDRRDILPDVIQALEKFLDRVKHTPNALDQLRRNKKSGYIALDTDEQRSESTPEVYIWFIRRLLIEMYTDIWAVDRALGHFRKLDAEGALNRLDYSKYTFALGYYDVRRFSEWIERLAKRLSAASLDDEAVYVLDRCTGNPNGKALNLENAVNRARPYVKGNKTARKRFTHPLQIEHAYRLSIITRQRYDNESTKFEEGYLDQFQSAQDDITPEGIPKYRHPNQPYSSDRQAKYYRQLRSSIESGNRVSLDNQTGYLERYLHDLIRDYLDRRDKGNFFQKLCKVEHLYSNTEVFGRSLNECVESIKGEAELLDGNYRQAWHHMSEVALPHQLQGVLGLKKYTGFWDVTIADAYRLGESGLTDYGRRNRDLVIDQLEAILHEKGVYDGEHDILDRFIAKVGGEVDLFGGNKLDTSNFADNFFDEFSKFQNSYLSTIAEFSISDFRERHGDAFAEYIYPIYEFIDLSEVDTKFLKRHFPDNSEFERASQRYSERRRFLLEDEIQQFYRTPANPGRSLTVFDWVPANPSSEDSGSSDTGMVGVNSENPSLKYDLTVPDVSLVRLPNLIHESFRHYVIRLLRQAENATREAEGVARIGEGWVRETELFNNVRAEFPSRSITQHASPSWLGDQHFDIYFVDDNVAIEYQGRQHSEPIDYFGGREAYEQQKRRDERKQKVANEHDCKLIYVYPDYDLEDALSRIRSALD